MPILGCYVRSPTKRNTLYIIFEYDRQHRSQLMINTINEVVER